MSVRKEHNPHKLGIAFLHSLRFTLHSTPLPPYIQIHKYAPGITIRIRGGGRRVSCASAAAAAQHRHVLAL